MLWGLARNPALPSRLLDRLIEVADGPGADDLARRGDLGVARAVRLVERCPETAVVLVRAGLLAADVVDPRARPLAALALLAAGTGAEWAPGFAADPVVEHRVRLAECPGLPGEVVDRLAADPDPRVVAELALWTTSAEVVDRLARHPHAEVRAAVALNEAASPAVLAGLLGGEGFPSAKECLVCAREEIPFRHESGCQRVGCDLPAGASCDGSHESTVVTTRWRVVGNPATPAEAVIGFVDDPWLPVREQLASRPDLPPSTYRRLAADPIPGVRRALAENPAIDEDLIRALVLDDGHDVRRGLAHNPRVPLDVLAVLTDAARIGPVLLPRVAAATAAEVGELAASPNPELRMLLAQRRDLPPAVRDVLAADPDAKVAASIAAHPGLSEASLRAVVDRHGIRVHAAVAANPDAPAALLEELALHRPPIRKALHAIARHPNATATALLPCLADPKAKPLAAAHPALPAPTITALLAADPATAMAAAGNSSLPLAAMASLVP
ncbi:hypothetical protein CLV40_10478 [Actinokineospora auranticolor]|uniref:Leucine rich repeat (LRR) protein n=1 Tax=Actinokineospora auranticolor TaxID=155976 RepID=A0A2S6GUE8_9PSEU|nr:hypothetical protein CLV40_10478 [Actinokineospora auranticolor]